MLAARRVPDFDDTIGGPIVQAMILLLLIVLGYHGAIPYAVVRAAQQQARARQALVGYPRVSES